MNGPDSQLPSSVEAAPLPEVLNHTAFPSQYFQMMDVKDQVFHVMVSRMTFNMCKADQEGYLQLADQQVPLIEADQHYGDTETTSVIQESDFAPFKPKCDVLFSHAVAYAPNGEPAKRWPVGVRVGDWQKCLDVCGPRTLERNLGVWSLSSPEPVKQVPIRYEYAWGGTCQWPLNSEAHEEPELYEYAPRNPVGVGFSDRRWRKQSGVRTHNAPCLEAYNQPFTAADAASGDYPVVGLGPVGRGWEPRIALAGTYDDAWKQTRWPRLPEDFDFAYWNAAPADQQIPYPSGGEPVVMLGLHPNGDIRFKLPKSNLKLLLHLKAGVPLFKPLVTDTLIFDMQALTLTLVQRAVVTARAEVTKMELGTWNIAKARAENAQQVADASISS